jgi:VWFA-related protein
MDSSRASPALIALLAVAVAAMSATPAQSPEQPREVGLLEHAEARLAQLDITVTGAPEIVGTLTADDFAIKINFTTLDRIQIDRLCGPAEGVEASAADRAEGPSAELPPRPGPSYLFYFDQPHLTLAGRQRALDVAAELIEQLITGNARAMIVSNAARLELIEPLTGDPERLRAALNRLEGDQSQWDVWAELESSRIDEVVRLLNDDQDVSRAISLARIYQKEERWRTEQNLRRLELALGLLSDLEAPKAAVYFADTMRSNPGEHYLSFFGNALRIEDPALGVMTSDSLTSRLPFDRVVNLASAQGTRIYAIEARGLVNEIDLNLLNPKAFASTGTVASTSRVRVGDAQRALGDLATETGGRAFLHGVRGARIAERILDDASCLYLASFDPSGFREDVPLRVSVSVSRPGVQVRSRGRIVFPSESTRLTTRLLRAFGTAGEIADPFDLRVGLVPVSFEGGRYSALLQVSVPGSPLSGAAWDLGVSLVSKRKVRSESSGRIQVSGPGVPVVLESEIRFEPGAHEVVSVAHEATTGFVASEETVLDWPAPGRDRAVLTPFVLLQPFSAAFLRDGETRLQGSLVLGAAEAARADRHTALVGLVCHGRRQKGPLSVERTLTGRHEESFPPLLLDLDEDRCAQVRDLLPADTLPPGYYRYEVRVSEQGEILHERSLEFFVRDGGSESSSPD